MNDKIVDILAVLQIINNDFKKSNGEIDTTQIRQEAVKKVANKFLEERRFINYDSARKSIHDACVRRLFPDIRNVRQFDKVVSLWLRGNSKELKDILLRHCSTEYYVDKVELFFLKS